MRSRGIGRSESFCFEHSSSPDIVPIAKGIGGVISP